MKNYLELQHLTRKAFARAIAEVSRGNIVSVRQIDIGANRLASVLLALSETEQVCILDSCGVGHLGSHLMVAGIRPTELLEASGDVVETLGLCDRMVSNGSAAFFTLSYEFGRKLHGLSCAGISQEPDLFIAQFDCLIIHDYAKRRTFVTGNESKFEAVCQRLETAESADVQTAQRAVEVGSNFSRDEYLAAIESIKEHIRSGDTYQTNLTQQFALDLWAKDAPPEVFLRLRRNHPAPFSAYLRRKRSTVVSASPERFFHLNSRGQISASPIKGTRPRGTTPDLDAKLRHELLTSEKDRAENTMIVDLLRNDLGRVCDYGTVRVEKLCEIEEHPTLFHLVSTISGRVRDRIMPSDILTALFPCGSITGAPKLRTMELIDEIETAPRGLSMGAIGYSIPAGGFDGIEPGIDTSVAIRTVVFEGRKARFNVGGGIVIDSDPAAEYDESLLKSKALLNAML